MKPRVPTAQMAQPQKTMLPRAGAVASLPIVRPRTQQVLPDLSYVRGDLIRVGLASGIIVLVLIILWLVL